jgi:hypothetical protein
MPEPSEAKDEMNETQESSCIELEEELEAAQQEADDYKDKYLRGRRLQGQVPSRPGRDGQL